MLLGLVVGSFLNVVIHRLPLIMEREWRNEAASLLHPSPEAAQDSAPIAAAIAVPVSAPPPEHDLPARYSLSHPRSACPACMTPIAVRHNIPVLSWLMLRGRCASCAAPISVRYPLVELVTGILSAWVAWHFGFGTVTLCALGVTWALVALTGIDIDHQLLPDGITLPLLWAGLAASVVVGPVAGSPLPVEPGSAIVGAACGYLSLWLVYHGFRLVTGKEGMGYGDFKLFAALGAWLGWKILPLVILLSAATGAVVGIALIVLRGRDRATPIPFGPYLAAAGWIAMMYGDSLIDGYMRVSGLHH